MACHILGKRDLLNTGFVAPGNLQINLSPVNSIEKFINVGLDILQ